MEKNFLPFGSQYYRAPTPLEQDWESDLKNIKDCGFNTIKIWAVWRSNNPKEGVYDFSDIQKLMDLAEKYGLKVIINTIFDAAPAWFYKKYPESRMVTADGRFIEPRTSSCRQSGGAPGPCLHNPDGIRVRQEFLQELSKRFSNHPAMYVWDIWNEPFFGGGDGNDMACYCPHTYKRFKSWLREKYTDIDGLNNAWHCYYNDFDEVEMPVSREAFKNMIDWRMFISGSVTEEARMRVRAVKEFDSVHPVMLHTVPLPHFTMVSGCGDDYNLAKECDLFGNSLGSTPYTATISKSAAIGKTVISSEIHAIGGVTFERPQIPKFSQMKRHIFIPLSHGIKGFYFWQYRPERIGLESPAWGLTDLAGNKTPWLEMAVKINNGLQKYKDIILNAEPEPARIAVVNCPKEQLFCYCADANINRYFEAVRGTFDLLYESNYRVDIISSDQIKEGGIDSYKMICYPLPYYMEEETAARLREWVKKGNTLVSDAFFAAYNADTGLHETTVPGMGFSEVFGVSEGRVMTAAQFNNAYSEIEFKDSEKNNIDIFMDTGFGGLAKNDALKGFYFSEGLIPRGAETIASFGDGTGAVTLNSYGDGFAVLAGSLLGNTKSENNAKLLSAIAQRSGIGKSVEIDALNVRADILSGSMLVVCNNNKHSAEVSIKIKGNWLTDIITGERIEIKNGFVKLDMLKEDCNCYIIS